MSDYTIIISTYIVTIFFLALAYIVSVFLNKELNRKYKYVDNVGIKTNLGKKLLFEKNNECNKVFLMPFICVLITLFLLVVETVIFIICLAFNNGLLNIISNTIALIYLIIIVLLRRR